MAYKNEKTRRSCEWAKKNPEKRKAIAYRYVLKKNYGLTEDAYEVLRQSQNGRCKLCGNNNKRLVVDHDHYTGRVRGLLCDRCNNHLSFVEHPGRLQVVTDYLKGV